MGRRGFYLPSQSLRDSSPRVGAKGEREERIVTGGNPWKGPRQCEHWLAMTPYLLGLLINLQLILLGVHPVVGMLFGCFLRLLSGRYTAVLIPAEEQEEGLGNPEQNA